MVDVAPRTVVEQSCSVVVLQPCVARLVVSLPSDPSITVATTGQMLVTRGLHELALAEVASWLDLGSDFLGSETLGSDFGGSPSSVGAGVGPPGGGGGPPGGGRGPQPVLKPHPLPVVLHRTGKRHLGLQMGPVHFQAGLPVPLGFGSGAPTNITELVEWSLVTMTVVCCAEAELVVGGGTDRLRLLLGLLESDLLLLGGGLPRPLWLDLLWSDLALDGLLLGAGLARPELVLGADLTEDDGLRSD